MKISTKGRYALRLMMDLAENLYRFVAQEVLGTTQIPYGEYVLDLGKPFERITMLDAVKKYAGVKMEPQNYTVGMILRQTEGSLAPVACIEDDEIVCDRQQQCVTSIVYKKINDAISGVVDNITLQDLVDWQNEKNGNYVI